MQEFENRPDITELWPQKQAHVILEQIRDAVSEDSVVLVHESVVPESGTSYVNAQLDWHMTSVGA